MNKTEQLLIYLISLYTQQNVTSLMKLCYLADLMSVKKDKKQISDFSYKRYYFGPFDKKIYTYLESLISKEIIIPQLEYDISGNENLLYKINDKNEKEIILADLSKKEKKIIHHLIERVKGYGAKALTEIAYNTKPLKALNATIGGNENLNKELELSL